MSEDVDTFLSQIDRRKGANSCWLWTGKMHADGYGRWKGGYAHRVAYALKHGPLSEDAVVRHKCDNPPCCNPMHLEVGTHAENRQDCVEKRRHARGDMHGRAKLTECQVRAIRERTAGMTHKQIARKYGVSRSTITRILNPETYALWGAPGSLDLEADRISEGT